jgi:hypothetical protein
MEINRNQYFFAGLVLLFLGLQYLLVDTLVLKPECAKLLGEEQSQPIVAARSALGSLVPTSSTLSSKTVRPPEWIGWALLSLGAVLVLHSWAMPRPG